MVRTPSRSRKTDILRAAARLFLVGGYSHTSVAQVAGAVGMLKGSLYHHIRSKEDLLAEVILDALRSAESNLLGGSSAAEDGPGIRRRLQAHFEYLSSRHAGLAALLRETEQLPRARREIIRNRVGRYEERLAQTIRLGQHRGVVAAGDPAALVQLMIGACTWACWIDREPEQQALVNHGILRLLFPGIGNSNPLTPERERFSSSHLLDSNAGAARIS